MLLFLIVLLIACYGLLLLAIGSVFVGAFIKFQDPNLISLMNILQTPNDIYWLGADELGRDVLSRLISGMGVSIFVGVCVLLLAGTIGTAIGVISGWYGGVIDAVLMRVTDVFLSFPGILIAISFAALAGTGVENVIYALGLMGWVSFARLARVQTMAIKTNEYIEAAKLSGVITPVIIIAYVLPNIVAPLIVEGVFTVAGAMLSEAGLSFLGIGIQPPDPSLGFYVKRRG